MAGHARSIQPIVEAGAQVSVPVHGQGGPVLVIDARPKRDWTPEEVRQAVEEQQRKAGALVALVRSETEATWAEIRRELNELAGGQASARVMVLAHHALRAHQALELQTLLAEVAAGKHGEGQRADPNNGLRNQSGLSVIATQALNQAYEAAKAERVVGKSPTAQLLERLGVGVAVPESAGEVPGRSPVATPGAVDEGSPTAPLSPPTGES